MKVTKVTTRMLILQLSTSMICYILGIISHNPRIQDLSQLLFGMIIIQCGLSYMGIENVLNIGINVERVKLLIYTVTIMIFAAICIILLLSFSESLGFAVILPGFG